MGLISRVSSRTYRMMMDTDDDTTMPDMPMTGAPVIKATQIFLPQTTPIAMAQIKGDMDLLHHYRFHRLYNKYCAKKQKKEKREKRQPQHSVPVPSLSAVSAMHGSLSNHTFSNLGDTNSPKGDDGDMNDSKPPSVPSTGRVSTPCDDGLADERELKAAAGAKRKKKDKNREKKSKKSKKESRGP